MGLGNVRQPARAQHSTHARRVALAHLVDPEHELDLDALLGGLRPVLKGLDGDKINEVSNAVIELMQGHGGELADLLSNTGSFTQYHQAKNEIAATTTTAGTK